MTSHPSPGDKSPGRGRVIRTRVNLNRLYYMHQGSPLLPKFIVAQPPPPSFCCQRASSRHSSNLTSVYLVPALNLRLPSTHFREYSSILSMCPNHLNTLSTELDHSLSFPALLSFFPTSSIYDTPSKLLKNYIPRIFNFLLSALLIPQASAPFKPLLKLLL